MAVVCWVGSVNKSGGGGGCKPDFVWRSLLVVDL